MLGSDAIACRGIGGVEKSPHESYGFFRCIFEHPVPHVGESMDFGIRPDLFEAVQAVGPEAPIAHAPDQQRGPVGERRQSAFNFREGLPGCVARTAGDVLDEAVHSAAIRPSVVRREVSVRHRRVEPWHTGEGHPQRGAAEEPTPLNCQPTDNRQATRPNSPGDISRRKRTRIEEHNPLEPLRHPQHRAEPNGTAPILCHQRDPLQVQSFDQRRQIRDVVRRAPTGDSACRSARTPSDRVQRTGTATRATESDSASGKTRSDSHGRIAASRAAGRPLRPPFHRDNAIVRCPAGTNATRKGRVPARGHRWEGDWRAPWTLLFWQPWCESTCHHPAPRP